MHTASVAAEILRRRATARLLNWFEKIGWGKGDTDLLTNALGVLALMLGCSALNSKNIIVELRAAYELDALADRGIVGRPMFQAADKAAARSTGLDKFILIDTDDVSIAAQLDLLKAQNEVVNASEDRMVQACERIPNDVEFSRQYSLRNTGQVVGGNTGTIGADINAADAWDISTGSSAVAIAILDTGVSATHPDLAAKIIAGKNFIGSDESAWEDGNGHGTHSAGIAAARSNNGLGVAGVCWNCSLVVARVLDDHGTGVWSGVASAIVWAADQQAVRVISLNLGGAATDAATLSAVNYAAARGKILVAAAGNTYGGNVLFPAQFENCIAVSATNNNDNLAEFSAVGSAIDLAAPGAEVYSAFGTPGTGDTYAVLSGTSMAAPHVAGLAGLLWSINPALSASRVRQILESTAQDLGSQGRDNQFGAGRIDAGRAAAVARASLCNADVNFDGVLDFFDYLDFVALFSGGDRVSDFNADGTIDFFDYLDFAMAFASGCP